VCCVCVVCDGVEDLVVIHCRPLINQKFEEKTCGQGPSLSTVFDDDTKLQELSDSIQV